MVLFSLLWSGSIGAQTVEQDSIDMIENPQPTDDEYRVVTNSFWDNWFVLGSVGYHAFFGDYGKVEDFAGKLSPDFNVGVGKWFTPGIGVKLQFGMGNSRGYSKEPTPFTYGQILINSDGVPYWKTKNKWWDLNANVMFNLSRLFCGYEGIDSDKLMNQFIFSAGIGALHHRDIGPQRNEWSGHLEMQYSRFFSKKKNLSLDLKLYTTLFQTNFDAVTLKATGESSKWFDNNTGIRIGMTYYFKKRGWERCAPCAKPVYITRPVINQIISDCPEYKSMVFYVFFPNNYSGRDDAPVVFDAAVNSIDYLASGIFTQKKFEDNDEVAARLASGASLSTLRTTDVATDEAGKSAGMAGVSRGYEISSSPISLDMDAESMNAFKEKNGYYYAPVYSGNKAWYYRVDNATKNQSLMSGDNYKESTSYGLNAHAGLGLVKENMKPDTDAELFSFADIYAAIEGNEGYTGQFADSAAVSALKRIFEEGRILHVQAEGLATSQDNYTGKDAANVGLERNKTLAHNRAYSVIKWLKENERFKKVVGSNFSLNTLTDPIATVNDKSTQGLNAKLNRCVKVKIHYVVDK